MLDLLKDLARCWRWPETSSPYTLTADLPFNEAGLLKLNCDKALAQLRWTATLRYEECVQLVGDWYHSYDRGAERRGDAQALYARTVADIERYEALAWQRGLRWSGDAPSPLETAILKAA